ncbi:NADH dehydrogenase [ubiquinone] 1 alpha subcomplex subunit 10, mitochondrial [Halyomorpha halys]|uniref:NADH dehydrogenase [ubiquinone] 1 alpha subcomplex subunit 10, mitochondrial n=1 Tax=Halyomorpha halys TaxID=286706 RepID=UPI0006D4F7C7|nr:NADH dehydrogenase [ubiquinone] 1 alpha subcomplex subunit 10, mitochondrial [Halyomorpha halys]
MSLKLLNSSIIRLGNQYGSALSDGFLKAKTGVIFKVYGASITSKAFREVKKKPAPFPYKEKTYGPIRSLFDKTIPRLDENSKIIVVEGSVAVGKTDFAKALAEDLDFYHIEDATMDIVYKNSYGDDFRVFDHKLPLSMQSYDEKKFCQEPKHLNTAAYQIWMYRLRYSLYVDALAHLLSTGQGVVIERSPWSDVVFLEAMYKNGYISKNARRGYLAVKKNTINLILRPHLVIFLDAPVNKIKEKIKSRGYRHEENSPALTDQYLQDLEDVYKTEYLAKVSSYAELLMYDWSEGGDVEVVVEDIERIDFEGYTMYDEKFQDWFIGNKEQDWAEIRNRYADKKSSLMHMMHVPFLDAPELVAPGEDIAEYNNIINSSPQFKYSDGFNPNRESNLLFKISGPKYVKY